MPRKRKYVPFVNTNKKQKLSHAERQKRYILKRKDKERLEKQAQNAKFQKIQSIAD